MKQTNAGKLPSLGKDTDLREIRNILQSNSKGFQLHQSQNLSKVSELVKWGCYRGPSGLYV